MEEIKENKKIQNVFKIKNYLLLFQGTAVSNIAAILYDFALSFYILKITNNNTIIQGTYLAMCGVVFIIFSFCGGVIADRFNKVKIIYGSDFIKGSILLLSALVISIAISSGLVNLQIVIIFIIGFINNIIASTFSPASQSLMPLIVEDNQLQQANSYMQVLTSFESILGIILAGLLYSLVPITVLFLIIGSCYILSGISELFIKIEYKKSETKLTIKSMLFDLKDGFKYLLPQKAILSLIFGMLFINFFFSPCFSNAMPYVISVHVASSDYLFKEFMTPEMWSSIFTVCFSIGSLIAGIVIGNIHQNEKCGKKVKKWLFTIGFLMAFLAVIFYVFIALNNKINYFLIGTSIIFFFAGIAIVNINVPLATLFQRKIEKEKMAKVWSLINIGSQGMIPIASFLAGIIIKGSGVGVLFVICAVGFILTAFIVSLNKEVDNL